MFQLSQCFSNPMFFSVTLTKNVELCKGPKSSFYWLFQLLEFGKRSILKKVMKGNPDSRKIHEEVLSL